MGVGPGHPGLATVQAVEAIKEADIVRHSEGCDVGPLDSADEVVRLARTGRNVTVLFPGNPYAFSNGSEIAERLHRAGVDFEAVPGLILELAAPVMSGIPLTIEGRSASIGFGLVKGAETVVLRLASGWWESGITALLADGRTPQTPAALILNPGQPGQHRVGAPLGELARKAATYGLRGDALLVLGPGVEMSEQFDTMAKRPLHGRRILITRAQHQVDPLRRELVDMGAAVVEIPTIEVRAMPTDDRVRKAMTVNLDANLLLMRACHPFLKLAPRGGRVVVIGSKNVPAPGPGASAYSASKAALNQLARIAALEWGADRIRVNTVHPNAVFDTGLWTEEVLAERARQYAMTVEQYKTNNVLKTEVGSRDVAELAAEMCGPLFAKTTGAQVPVDGGNERVI